MHITGDSKSTKVVQTVILEWPLIFLWRGQICFPNTVQTCVEKAIFLKCIKDLPAKLAMYEHGSKAFHLNKKFLPRGVYMLLVL